MTTVTAHRAECTTCYAYEDTNDYVAAVDWTLAHAAECPEAATEIHEMDGKPNTDDTVTVDDPVQAAKFDLDSARGHVDTALSFMHAALAHLDGRARRTRAGQILATLDDTLAYLDRLREAM